MKFNELNGGLPSGTKKLTRKFKELSKKTQEPVMKTVFFISACVTILCVVLICVFVFEGGLPPVIKYGINDFLFGRYENPIKPGEFRSWWPSAGYYSILPFIITSIYVTFGAIVVGVPLGLLSAVFMARMCPKWLHKILSPLISLLAGIPSVIYGFVGAMVLVPMVKDTFDLKSGSTIFTASVMLGVMILPTIINISESSLRAVPENYFEGALALGASKERSIFFVVLPAAKSGILAAIVLGIGRAIGETMAVMMVVGGKPQIPTSFFDGAQTMTAHIATELGYADDIKRGFLLGTAVVLFIFILIINTMLQIIKRGEKA